MSVKPRPIVVDSETDFVGLLSRAAIEPVLLEYQRIRFRLNRIDADEEPDAQPSREEVLRILDQVAGSWRDLDTDQLVEEIYEARRAGSRPDDRP